MSVTIPFVELSALLGFSFNVAEMMKKVIMQSSRFCLLFSRRRDLTEKDVPLQFQLSIYVVRTYVLTADFHELWLGVFLTPILFRYNKLYFPSQVLSASNSFQKRLSHVFTNAKIEVEI